MTHLVETWILTGIPGAGKTTTAGALAVRFPRGAHIPGDVIQHLLVGGSAPDPFGGAESERMVDLGLRNMCLLARSFRCEGVAVVLDYVIGSADRLQQYLDLLPDEPVGLVVLNPSIDVTRRRDRTQTEDDILPAWAHLQEELADELGGHGLWLDTSQMSVAATVEAILARQDEAVVN